MVETHSFSLFWGLLIRKFGKVNAKLSSSPKYCYTITKKAIKFLVFRDNQAMSIYLEPKSVQKLMLYPTSLSHSY